MEGEERQEEKEEGKEGYLQIKVQGEERSCR